MAGWFNGMPGAWGLKPKQCPSPTPCAARRGTERKAVLTRGAAAGVFQEIGCSRKVAINGARELDMLVCRHSGGRVPEWRVVEDCGEVALTPGVRSLGCV